MNKDINIEPEEQEKKKEDPKLKRFKRLKNWVDRHGEFEVYRAYRTKEKWRYSFPLVDIIYYIKAKRYIDNYIKEAELKALESKS